MPRSRPLTARRPGSMRRRVAIVSVLAALVAACGGTGDGGDGGAGDGATLDGTYRLLEGRGPSGDVPILDDAPITLVIDGEQWGGTAACNSYGGTVKRSGDALTVGDVFRTEMACLDEGVMEAEGIYLDAFTAVDGFARDGDALVLSGPDTELTFAFVPPEPDAPLVGTRWILASLVSGSGSGGAVTSVTGEPPLEFAEDGTFTAGTGCNTLGGDYTVEGTALTIRDAAGTAAGCPDSLTAAQDEMVAGVLADGELSVTIDGGSLRLMTSDDHGLEYRAASDTPSQTPSNTASGG